MKWNFPAMKRFLFASVAVAALAGGVACSQLTSLATSAAATLPGQLFCTLATANGGQIVTAVNATIDTAASALGPLGGIVAVLATNESAAFVQSACTAAAKATGAVSGVPQSPPPASVAPSVTTIPASALPVG
jgi:hypothetical protein